MTANTAPPMVFRGVFFALLAYGLFSTQDALIKHLSERLSVFQIICFAMLFAIIPLLGYALARNKFGALRVRSPKLMLLRTLCAMLTMPFAFYAFSVLPMQETYAIIFAAPIFITLLAIPMLGEHVHAARAMALLIGFCGILVVLRPGMSTFELGHLSAIMAAFFIAMGAIFNRMLGASESKFALLWYPTVGSALFCMIALIWVYVPMTLREVGLLALVMLFSLTAQVMIILAYTAAPAAVIAPFQYTQMFWAILFGYYFFAEPTDSWTWVGTGLIILSGLIILVREARSRSSLKPVLNSRGLPSSDCL